MPILPSDTDGTHAAITAVAANVAAIVPYVQAVQAIRLGGQPLTVDGTNCGSYDPLGGSPATEAALSTAQAHCKAFSASTLSGLALLPVSIALATGSSDGSGILKDLATLADVQGTQDPTADQQAAFYEALNDIVTQINSIDRCILRIQAGAQTFQAGMASDVQAFTNGSASLASSLTQMQQTYESQCIQYSIGPFGATICNILGSVYDAMQTDLESLQRSISTAAASEGSVVPALSKLQDLFSELKSSYSSVAHQVQSVSQQQFASFMQQVDVSVLSLYWQDTTAFAQRNGFGVRRA